MFLTIRFLFISFIFKYQNRYTLLQWKENRTILKKQFATGNGKEA